MKNARSKKKDTKEIVKKRKKSKRKYLLYYIIFFLLLLAGFSVLSLTVLFKIESIVINSDAPYADAEIEENLGVKKGDNLLRASKAQAEENLRYEFPYIKEISFRRHLPDELVVTVQGEKAEVSSEEEGRTVLLSKEGKALEILKSQNSKGLPRVCGLDTQDLVPGEFIKDEEKEKLSILLNLQQCLKDEDIKADVIDIRDLSSIRVLYDGRVDIYLGGSFEHDYKTTFAKTAIESSVNTDFVGILDVSKRPTARLRPVNIFLPENWEYPSYLLEDYEKVLLVKPNAIIPKETVEKEKEEEKKKEEEEEAKRLAEEELQNSQNSGSIPSSGQNTAGGEAEEEKVKSDNNTQ